MRPLRLAVLADIHGNLVALEAVLAELGRVPNLSGFLPAAGPFARACLRNMETGCNFLGRFVALGHSLAAEAGQAAGDVLPDDIWQQAEAIFDWNCATRSY